VPGHHQQCRRRQPDKERVGDSEARGVGAGCTGGGPRAQGEVGERVLEERETRGAEHDATDHL